MADIRAILFGVGGLGREFTRLVQARRGYRIVAAHSRNSQQAGHDLGVLAGLGPNGVEITADQLAALAAPADILVILTTSFLRDLAPVVREGVARGLNVVTAAEEMAYPWLADAALADELDRLAMENNVTILGAGVNPGFLSDALVLTAAGVAWDVNRISLKRGLNLSRFSSSALRKLGIGFSPQEFGAGVSQGAIYGHIGFPESMHLVARALGVSIQRVTKRLVPLVADRTFVTEHVEVRSGLTAGFRQYATAFVDDRPWYEAEFFGHVDPDAIGEGLEDSIQIDGYSPVHLALIPGLKGLPASAAIIANSLRRVVQAPPGLMTVADLRPATPSGTLLSEVVRPS